MIAIDIKHLSMRFNMPTEKITSIKEYFIKYLKDEIRHENFTALQDINIEIEKGDSVAIVGANGSGKSTLLKIVSGIYPPSEGTICVNGSIAPMIELGAGFDMELTARENIYLNGTVLGRNNKSINQYFDELVKFSELEEFINIPIKNFSSGMLARLAFSSATALKSDILICDEILGVGDIKFQEKCFNKIQNMISDETTFLFVSHSVEKVCQMCKKAIFLEKGKLIMYGEAEKVCEYYKERLYANG